MGHPLAVLAVIRRLALSLESPLSDSIKTIPQILPSVQLQNRHI